MHRIVIFVICHLAILLGAAALALPADLPGAHVATTPPQESAQAPAPVILAQGRCYNGRCF